MAVICLILYLTFAEFIDYVSLEQKDHLLVDTTMGGLMPVDFACLFDHGLNLETPKRVPFRLTPNLLHTMGLRGADGAVGLRLQLKWL